ncbi:hypothetical protein PFWH6_3364 [Pseudomonas fluorescens WH6]|nr:hypothetical protein PFWH6_3364 [Pseudomonas fluorescens WH6]
MFTALRCMKFTHLNPYEDQCGSEQARAHISWVSNFKSE